MWTLDVDVVSGFLDGLDGLVELLLDFAGNNCTSSNTSAHRSEPKQNLSDSICIRNNRLGELAGNHTSSNGGESRDDNLGNG